MWRQASVLLLCLAGFSVQAQVSFGEPEKINRDWRFILKDDPAHASVKCDESAWQKVALPHDWSVKGKLDPALASCTGYLPGGIGWYRKTLSIPASKKDGKVYLYFEGVYNRSEVFVNGKPVGHRPNGYISFLCDITPYVKFGGESVVAVRVDHSRYDDSRWYSGSGIYRDVWLVTANRTHIAPWGVFTYPTEATAQAGTLKVETQIDNGDFTNATVTLLHELKDPENKTVASTEESIAIPLGTTGKSVAELKVANPKLWDLEHPNRYTLITKVMQDGKVIDQTVTRTGFRTFAFDPDKGFALNGQSMKMKGVCLHHDAGVLGSAFYRDVWKSRLLTLKSLGCNAIRTSHNPQAPALYDLCDELGILVMNEMFDEWEFNKHKWIQGWNVGQARYNGSSDFFPEWGERDLADLVRRDRNHLSIFAWSIGNEIDYPNDPYALPSQKGASDFTQAIYERNPNGSPNAMRLGPIAKRLVATVKQYDTSRPTTAGLAGVSMSNETEYPGALDITGYNYTEGRYLSDHKKYPKRVIYGSENRHDMGAWKAVRDNPHIFGQFLWTGIGYLGEAHKWPSRGFYAGLLDFGGFVKPLGHYRAGLWSDTPIAALGTYPTPKNEKTPSQNAWPVWNYDNGASIRIVCYTNAAKARLELNEKAIGDLKNHDDNTGIIFWDIPFEAGTLMVIGMDKDGKETCRHAIRTVGKDDALKIVDAPAKTIKDGVTPVVIQIVDEKGIPSALSETEITCTIDGPGELLGLEAGNNTDMGDYTDNVQRAYRGRLIAYIRATGKGVINIKFTAPQLKSAEIAIQAE